MIPAAKRALREVARKPKYKPILSRTERLAYQAAHQLLSSDLTVSDLACPGGRRAAVVDKMAGIIKTVFEAR